MEYERFTITYRVIQHIIENNNYNLLCIRVHKR